MTEPLTPAAIDVEHLAVIRENVRALLRSVVEHDLADDHRILEIAPQDHAGVREFLPPSAHLETLDLDPDSGATYIGDITKMNAQLASDQYDCVVCTEVLEHTLQPFDAIVEIRRVLRPGGLFVVSVPFNFRIHGPLPDCWRFTEHGLRALLSTFESVNLAQVETPDRPLMPIHLTATARKPR